MACGARGSIKTLTERLGIAASINNTGLSVTELAATKSIPEDFLRGLGVIDGFAGSPANRRPCVDIPYMDLKGQIVAVQKRLSLTGQPRFIWRRGDHPIPYGLWRLKEAYKSGYLILVEGASDAWTLWLHEIPALGLPGASTWKAEYAELSRHQGLYLG